SEWVVGAGSFGLFVYGALNRLLIVTGLHHVLNNIAWFILGDYNGATGDLNRFFAGDKSAGAFMSGFFPVMMFGLPAACFAMYRAALPGRRKQVGGMFLSLGLTSFLTGVTEPVEFTFMFLAPLLYVLHVILTGLSMVVMDALNVKLGFGFSAGLFDYVLNYGLATNPLLLLPVGSAYALIYYSVFSFVIRRFNLMTPGRENDEVSSGEKTAEASSEVEAYILALGGAGNVQRVDACTTRLRLELGDTALVNDAALKRAGARGTVTLSQSALQVVIGPRADQLADDIRQALGSPVNVSLPLVTDTENAPVESEALIPSWVQALGNASNVKAVRHLSGRIVITLADPSKVVPVALDAIAPGGWVVGRNGYCHILI
ncbi:MAG: PTS transporter subunit EIIC, partial [Sphingorhabdus sp.]